MEENEYQVTLSRLKQKLKSFAKRKPNKTQNYSQNENRVKTKIAAVKK